jgi:uncharacterized protein YlaN (UPF0358 family)
MKERKSITIKVNPAVCLLFSQVIINNMEGLLKNMNEQIGLTGVGEEEIKNIVQELQEKSLVFFNKQNKKPER